MKNPTKIILSSAISTALLTISLSASAADNWKSNHNYDHGDLVDYNGLTFNAKWWSNNYPPTVDASGPWQLVDANHYNSAYKSNYHYQKDQQVRHQGKLWQAQWYINQDTVPGSREYNGWLEIGDSDPLLDNLIAIESIDSNGTDFSDLQPLKEKIGDSRIVMLGEQSHGDGNSFKAKSRLVQFLHQEMNFDVLAFESGFYDMARVWEDVKQGSSTTEASQGNMFYMYAGSREMQPLFSYIDANTDSDDPLILTGIDSQHSGAHALNDSIAHLASFIGDDAINEISVDDWLRFNQLSQELMAFSLEANDDTEEHNFYLNTLASLKALAKATDNQGDELTGNSEFWQVFLDSLKGQYLSWRVHGRWSPEGMVDRESRIANNLNWLANNVYAGKKIVVWGHNLHVQNESFLPSIRDFLGPLDEETYTILFTAHQGQFNSWGADIVDIAPANKDSLEGRLNKGSDSFGFIDIGDMAEAGSWPQDINARIWDYSNDAYGFFEVNNWPATTDAFFFIREEQASTY